MTADIFRRKPRASFNFEIIDGVVVVYDYDIGCSVTNDAENVVAELARRLPHLNTHPVIYRDTDGVFDGLAVGENNRFVGFYAIQKTNLADAVQSAKEKEAELNKWKL